MGDLVLIRHGETEWSRSGRYAGRTDVPLTAAGVAAARALAPALARHSLVATFTSPLARATRTAEFAGLPAATSDPALAEWDYGGYEGLTAAQIRATTPDWSLWRDAVVPGDVDHPGEQLRDVAARADAVLDRVRPLLAKGDVALVSHGHLLRVLTARWLDLDPSLGRLFRHPPPGTLSVLGTEDEQTVVSSWNTR